LLGGPDSRCGRSIIGVPKILSIENCPVWEQIIDKTLTVFIISSRVLLAAAERVKFTAGGFYGKEESEI
jgi:hypothetical protein